MDNMVQQTKQFGSILSTSAAHNSRDNKTKDSKILQGKFNKLIYAKVVLWLGFFCGCSFHHKTIQLNTLKDWYWHNFNHWQCGEH